MSLSPRFIRMLVVNAGMPFFAMCALVSLITPFVAYKDDAVRRTYRGIEYDSRSKSSALSAPKLIREIGGSVFTNLTIGFRLNAYSMGEYSNVFQTAKTNCGIRLELSKPSSLAIVTAIKHRLFTSAQGLLATRSFRPGRWYDVRIASAGRKDLSVFLDGILVIDSPPGNLAYDISEITVGTGFSQERRFDGKIEGFFIEYDVREKKEGMYQILRVTTISFFVIGILFLIVTMVYAIGANSEAIIAHIRGRNMALIHVFFFSTAFIKISSELYSRFSIRVLSPGSVPINEWAQHLFFPDKPKQVLFYAVMITTLFVYYLLSYLLILNGEKKAWLFRSVDRRFSTAFVYLLLLCVVTMLLMDIPAIFFKSWLSTTPRLVLWFLLWILPFLPLSSVPIINKKPRQS